MTPLLGIDAYHGDQPLSFHDLVSSGVSFCFLKASQGVGSTDPAYQGYYARAKSVGLIVGAYHFFTADDPVRQAAHFLNAAKLSKGDLVHVLDVETYFGGVGAAALACAEEIKDQTGRNPIIYSGRAFYHDNLETHFPAGDYTLWLAEYGPRPDVACPFWQFSDHGEYPNNPPLDSNRFYGTLEDLKSHCL